MKFLLAALFVTFSMVNYAQESKIYNYRTDSITTRYVKNNKWITPGSIPNSSNILVRTDLNKLQIEIFGDPVITYFITQTISQSTDKLTGNKFVKFDCIDNKGEKYKATQLVNNQGFILYLQQSDFEIKYFFHRI